MIKYFKMKFLKLNLFMVSRLIKIGYENNLERLEIDTITGHFEVIYK